MTKLQLYEYKEGETTVVSPKKPADETIIIGYLFRLIADEGKLLKKEDMEVFCIDVEPNDVEGWIEIEDPDYNPDEEGGAPTAEE